MKKIQKKITILFLCTGNSCRSQMAEGWARTLKGDEIEVFSAGIEKHGLNPLAVKAMAEVGVDISIQKSTTIEELPVQQFDWVITLCGHAEKNCPVFSGRQTHRGFDDPPELAKMEKLEEQKLVHYQRVRDEIRAYVLTLPRSLTEETMV